jgi:hypothetical protein
MDRFTPFFLIPFIAWGIRRYLIQREDFSTLKKITLGIGITAYFITEMGRSFYRPYIYANDINDWVVADTIGNSFGTVTAIFIIITMSGRGTHWDWRLVGMVILGLLGYELTNFTGHHGFDTNDAIATILFGILSAVIYAGILRKFGNDQNEVDQVVDSLVAK